MYDSNNTKRSRRNYAMVSDVQDVLGCGEGAAYKYIAQMNKELADKGYLTVAGRIPWAYFRQRFGGFFVEEGAV